MEQCDMESLSRREAGYWMVLERIDGMVVVKTKVEPLKVRKDGGNIRQ